MGYYYSGATLQRGSQGSDVSEVQKFLRDQGYYTGSIDGDFGPKTNQALIDYQTANGLTPDGIFGPKTASAAGFANYNTPVSAPTIGAMPTNPPYDSSSYGDSSQGQAALANKNNIYEMLHGTYNPETGQYEGGIGSYGFSKQNEVNNIFSDLDDLGQFSYNFNEDALYQQYADKYQQQGELAMQDTMGQAAAMTGGYGNSYAQSVGQQAYQAHLSEMNDIIPELYQMSLDSYKMKKGDLYDKYNLLMSEDARERQAYMDRYNKLLEQLGLANDDYYKGAEMFYTEQDNKNDVASKGFNDAMSIWGNETDQAWKEAEWYEGIRRDARDTQSKSDVAGGTGKVENNTPPEVDEPEPTGFTGTTYSDAVAYVESKGGSAAGIMTASEWSRRRSSYKTTGQGGAEVKNYSSYAEYLADITEYLIENAS